MKKLAFVALLSFAASVLAGCCSYKITKEGGRDLVTVKNECWRLFSFIPLASGDPEYPNREVSVWFCDSLLLEVNTMILDEAMAKGNYRATRNLVSHREREKIIPFLMSLDTYHTSAELLH